MYPQDLAMALHTQDFSMFGELHGSKQTMVIAPQECHQHMTGPLPVVRGGQEPPPENVKRLHVLTDSGKNFLSHGMRVQRGCICLQQFGISLALFTI